MTDWRDFRMKYILQLIFVSLLMCYVSACSKGDANTEKTDKAERPPVAVEILTASASEMIEGIDVVGTLTPKFETEVKSQIVGLVREVYVTEWVRVKKNDPLARIDVSETEALVKRAEAAIESAKAGFLQAQVSAQRAEREKSRIKNLKEFGLSTQQNLDDAETEVLAANASVEASRAQIRAAEAELHQLQVRLSKGLIRSPMDGIVSLSDVNVGDLASDAAADKPLFKIVDNRFLKITFTVPSVDMAMVKVGDALTFSVDSLPGRTFSGKVMHINPEVEETDRSVKVIAEVTNTSGELKGGLFAKGVIETGMRKNIIQCPRSALVGFNVTAKKAGLYVVKENIARYREVITGRVSGDQVEISSGLNPGDKFVIRGVFNLKDNDRVIVSSGQVK
jgi:RND family efflux transporter MFP subunit